MATRISFLNIKGGTGKTSLLVNVASCLAFMGKRVLVVDFDAQSNSSIWLMRLDRWNALNRIEQALVHRPTTALSVHSVSPTSSVAHLRYADFRNALAGILQSIDTLRFWWGDHTTGPTISLWSSVVLEVYE